MPEKLTNPCSSVKLFRNTLLWGRRVEFSALTFCTVFSFWLQAAGDFCQNWNFWFLNKLYFWSKVSEHIKWQTIFCLERLNWYSVIFSIVYQGSILLKELFLHNLVWPFNFFWNLALLGQKFNSSVVFLVSQKFLSWTI